MARKPSPWYWPERNAWFVIVDGKRQPLGDHPANTPPPTKRKGKWVVPPSIDSAFHALMGAPKPVEKSPQKTGLTVAELLDKFLDWTQKHKAPRTYEWYLGHLQQFLNHLGPKAIAAEDLRPFHVVEWADKHPQWSNAYRKGAMVAVQRVYNWSEELGYLPTNPIKKIKKPEAQRRESHITPGDFTSILSRYPEGDPFRDLLLFAWNTGCRPQEACHIEPRHVHLGTGCIVIPQKEAKGKRKDRVILLNETAKEVVRRRLDDNPQGRVFTNEDGKPWKRFAIANRFDRLQLSVGIAKLKELGIMIEPLPRFNPNAYPDAKERSEARKAHQIALRDRRKRILKLAREHGVRFAAYDLRHGFATRMLEAGIDHITVATLMGHADGTQVAKTYQHLDQNVEYLKRVLEGQSTTADEGV